MFGKTGGGYIGFHNCSLRTPLYIGMALERYGLIFAASRTRVIWGEGEHYVICHWLLPLYCLPKVVHERPLTLHKPQKKEST